LKDRNNIKIYGDTTEKKFAHVERILQRMFRRVHKTIVGAMPKVPVMGYCDTPKDEIITRILIPGQCRLVDAAFLVDRPTLDMDGDVIPPVIMVEVKREAETFGRRFVLNEELKNPTMAFDLLPGDVLCVRSDMGIAGISYTLLFDFGRSLYTMQDIVISELEAVLDKNPIGADE
jgi:hypothetical protein